MGNRGSQVTRAASTALDALSALGWNARLRYQHRAIHAYSCTTLLGDVWINDDIISIMVEETQKQITEPIILVDSLFMLSLSSCTMLGSVEHSGDVKLVERKVKNMKPKSLVFLMHTNKCHWVVGFVDFINLTICYGKSSVN